MVEKAFSQPLAISIGGRKTLVSTVRQATDLLMQDWPAERGERHADALDTCLKVLEGYRSTVDAETAFSGAAREAGLLG